MIQLNDVTVLNIQRILFYDGYSPVGTVKSHIQEEGLPTHELIFKLLGEAETEFDGLLLKGKQYTVQYLPKGHGDIEYKVKTIEPGNCIDVYFDTDVNLSDSAFCIEINSPLEMKNLFEKIYNIWLKKDIEYNYDAMSVFYKILKLLIKSENEMLENPHYLTIKSAIDFLNLNFCSNEIDYKYVASLCNISYSYFRRLFLECMNTSPAKYVTNKKIEYAKELLESKLYTVSEVADIVGFNNVYYFSHAFKNITNLSPSAYRGV